MAQAMGKYFINYNYKYYVKTVTVLQYQISESKNG